MREAPRSRRLLADGVDAALGLGSLWLAHRRGWLTGARASRAGIAGRLLAPSGTLVREQLTSPGQRLVGLRTVDRRTGRRVAPWRTLAVLGAGAGGQRLARRLAPPLPTPAQERERERYLTELGAIYKRHPNNPAARETERAQLAQSRPPALHVNLWRMIAPGLAVGLATTLLRRRLTPTVEVVARPQSP